MNNTFWWLYKKLEHIMFINSFGTIKEISFFFLMNYRKMFLTGD